MLPSLASGSLCLEHFPFVFFCCLTQDSSWVPLPPGSLPRFPQPRLAPPEEEIGPLSTVLFLMTGTEEGLSECLSNEVGVQRAIEKRESLKIPDSKEDVLAVWSLRRSLN